MSTTPDKPADDREALPRRPKLTLGGVRPSYAPSAQDPEIAEEKRPLRPEPEPPAPRWLAWGPWLLFLALGAAMGMLRYRGTGNIPAILQSYGPFVALGLHVLIIILAFRDSVYSGILCLVLPGFSIFYLLALSDRLYLRAVVMGLLAGIGQDSIAFFQDQAAVFYRIVSGWITSH